MARHFDVPTVPHVTQGTVSYEPPNRRDPLYSPEHDVVKRVFTLPMLELECGVSLKNVQIGYECYGRLSESGDNAIVIPHYFTGSSHAAGRYRQSDPEPGYWDSIIGPGKPIDTNRYFVIGVDSLSNLNVKNPLIFTTGPTSINPDTGKPYGPEFPVVTMTDFVRAQYALCRFLGVTSLHAVAGPSMGSMQALEWAAQFPDFVQRVVGVIGGGLATEPYLIALLRQWCAPIYLDPKFKNGHYDPNDPPVAGLASALELVTLTALAPAWAQRLFTRRPAEIDVSPAASIDNLFAVESALAGTAMARSSLADANSFLRLAKAVQLFDVRPIKERIRAKILWIPAQSDLLLLPVYATQGINEMRELGLSVETAMLTTETGHLDGLNHVATVGDTIRRFLA